MGFESFGVSQWKKLAALGRLRLTHSQEEPEELQMQLQFRYENGRKGICMQFSPIALAMWPHPVVEKDVSQLRNGNGILSVPNALPVSQSNGRKSPRHSIRDRSESISVPFLHPRLLWDCSLVFYLTDREMKKGESKWIHREACALTHKESKLSCEHISPGGVCIW